MLLGVVMTDGLVMLLIFCASVTSAERLNSTNNQVYLQTVQTFLPYKSFAKSASCLDNRRLNKQLVECQQILNALLVSDTKGWVNHPATLMWKGYEVALCCYAQSCYEEWVKRGFDSQHLSKTKINSLSELYLKNREIKYPHWLGNKKFHQSHKSNLLRKDPIYYSQFKWDVPDDLEYIWPVKKLKES